MSIFNLKGANTRRVRAALADARTEQGLARIVFVGDSATAGYGTTRGLHDPVTRFRKQLERQGFTVGEILPVFVSNQTDPRLVFSTGNTWANQTGVYGLNSAWMTSAGTGTLRVAGTGRYCEVLGSNQSKPWSYTIDGGTPVSVTTTGAVTYQYTLIDCLTEGPHEIVITSGGTFVQYSYWFAVGFRPATGIVLQNAGISGATAANHIDQATLGASNVLSSSVYPGIDAAIIELSGSNELVQSIPATTWKPKLATLIDKYQAKDADVFLTITQQGVALPSADYQPFLDGMYDLATTKNVPLLDLTDEFGWGTTGDDIPGGHDMSTDGSHLTVVGNDAKAVLYNRLLDVGFGPLA